MDIKAIKSFFSPSRIQVSKELKNRGFEYLKKDLHKTAFEKDVYVRIFDSNKKTGLFTMQILRKNYEHVADVPEYAVKNQTGDSVYIPVEQVIATKDITPFKVLDSLKSLLNNL